MLDITDLILTGAFLGTIPLSAILYKKESKTEAVVIDDLDNPEIRFHIEEERRGRLKDYLGTKETASALEEYPSLKLVLSGLIIMDEQMADLKRDEANQAIRLDMNLAQINMNREKHVPSYWAASNVKSVASSAIDIMTLPSRSRMLKRAETETIETEEVTDKSKTANLIDWRRSMR